jgi:hypothetical protein
MAGAAQAGAPSPPDGAHARTPRGPTAARLTLREEDEASIFDVEYRLERSDTGTSFTQSSEFEWKKLPRVLHGTFARGVRRDVRAQLQALKAAPRRLGRPRSAARVRNPPLPLCAACDSGRRREQSGYSFSSSSAPASVSRHARVGTAHADGCHLPAVRGASGRRRRVRPRCAIPGIARGGRSAGPLGHLSTAGPPQPHPERRRSTRVFDFVRGSPPVGA